MGKKSPRHKDNAASNEQYSIEEMKIGENNIFMYYLGGLHPHSFGACLCLSALSGGLAS